MKDAVQEQLIIARKNQILDAAAKTFAEKGFHPTTIKDIAREAGIADGTIYNYFENKTALLMGILERMRQAAQQEAAEVPLTQMDFRSFMKAYVSHPLMSLKANDFALFRVVISEMLVNEALRSQYHATVLEPTLTLAEPFFQKWVDEGVIKPLDVRLLMRVMSGVVMGLMLEHIMGDELLQAEWDTLPDLLTQLILEGIEEQH